MSFSMSRSLVTVFLLSLMAQALSIVDIPEKHIIIIVPSYNNAQYYKKNMDSLVSQQYSHFHIIYIDDCSTDGTYHLVQEYINHHNAQQRVTLIKNEHRRGALANLYTAIHACDDTSIIVTVDGDDLLAHDKVLMRINQAYADPDVWMTYGQFVIWPSGELGWCRNFTKQECDSHMIRQRSGIATHLRTFYAKLFKKIHKEDLMYEGDFFAVTWDKAIMAPMLEMAHGKWKCISDVLYIYNLINPLSDARLYGEQQVQTASIIFGMKPYEPLEELW